MKTKRIDNLFINSIDIFIINYRDLKKSKLSVSYQLECLQ